MLSVKVSTKHQIVVPSQARRALGIAAGDRLTVEVTADALILRPRVGRSGARLRGLGREAWKGVDPVDYVRSLREEWDERDSRVTPSQLFARHRVVALDSNVFIYLFEGTGPLADAAEALLDGIDDGEATGVLASVGLTEVLTRPASMGEGALFERYADELRSIPNLLIVPLDAETAVDAAWGRSGHRDLGDAIHVATACRAGATCFVTNDDRVRPRRGVEVIRLRDIAVSSLSVRS